MGQNHLDNITINISLDAIAAGGANFFFPMFVADEANGTTLNGDRTRSYSDPADVNTDETASFLSAFTANNLRAGLAQDPRPPIVKVGRRDSVGGESYEQAYDLIRADDDLFYSADIESRLDADILAFGEYIEPIKRKVAIVQSGSGDFKTTGFPAALAALEGNERTMLAWHDDPTEAMAFAWACNRLAANPQNFSAPWDAGVAQVGATTALNATEKGFLDTNNANHGLPLDGALYFIDPGKNLAGRPFYEIVTRDVFDAVLQARVATTKVNLSKKFQKWPVTPFGQAKLLNLVNQLYDEMADLGNSSHFVKGQRNFIAPAITSDDLDNERLRITGTGRYAVSARLFQFDLNLTRQPIS